jgi:hypothetical protein
VLDNLAQFVFFFLFFVTVPQVIITLSFVRPAKGTCFSVVCNWKRVMVWFPHAHKNKERSSSLLPYCGSYVRGVFMRLLWHFQCFNPVVLATSFLFEYDAVKELIDGALGTSGDKRLMEVVSSILPYVQVKQRYVEGTYSRLKGMLHCWMIAIHLGVDMASDGSDSLVWSSIPPYSR